MDLLLNMTTRNISQWLVKTRADYYKRRYGGFEFGVRNPLAELNFTRAQDIFERMSKATNKGKDRLEDLSSDITFGALDLTDFSFGALENLALTSSSLDNVRVWFNNKGWAASVAYMNSVNNIILRASLEKAEESDFDAGFDWEEDDDNKYDYTKYGIALTNHPMNFTKGQLDKEVM